MPGRMLGGRTAEKKSSLFPEPCSAACVYPMSVRCIGVAALHDALSRQRYGIDTRMHRLHVPVAERPRRLPAKQQRQVQLLPGTFSSGRGLGGKATV